MPEELLSLEWELDETTQALILPAEKDVKKKRLKEEGYN